MEERKGYSVEGSRHDRKSLISSCVMSTTNSVRQFTPVSIHRVRHVRLWLPLRVLPESNWVVKCRLSRVWGSISPRDGTKGAQLSSMGVGAAAAADNSAACRAPESNRCRRVVCISVCSSDSRAALPLSCIAKLSGGICGITTLTETCTA